MPPLELHSLGEEVQKVGNDMYISLALANMRIYLAGGLLLALVAIVAVAVANYTRIVERWRCCGFAARRRRRCGVFSWRRCSAGAPRARGGCGGGRPGRIRSRELRLAAARDRTVVIATDASGRAAAAGGLVLLLVAMLVAVASAFSWWAFRHTANSSVRGT